MASNVHVSTTARNSMLDAIAALMNSGTINFYSGTQPATANTAHSGNTLLCTLTFGTTAFAASSSGTATANAITSGVIGTSGTASWVEVLKSDATTIVLHGSVATSSADVIVPTVTFTQNVTVSMSSATISLAA